MATVQRPGTISTVRQKTKIWPVISAIIAVLMIAAAIYVYLESQRTTTVLVLARDVAYGQLITSEDFTTIEVPFHRNNELAGLSSPSLAVGQYASRQLRAGDLAQPTMLMAQLPDQPIYPNGEELTPNMVPLPFSTGTIGPITHRDRVNLGYSDPSGNPTLCEQGGAAPTTSADGRPLAFACRLLSNIRVLYVEGNVAYLEVTPYQAHTIWAIQAANLPLWGERYGASSIEIDPLIRLDIANLDLAELTAPPIPAVETDDAEIEGQP